VNFSRNRARAIRLWFRILARIAPGWAERRAARIFLTPHRRRRARELGPDPRNSAVTVEVDGLRLAGWSWGEGPTILLLHGWSGCAADLEPLALAVAEAGFRVVLLDIPGHGWSPGRETSLIQWVRAVSAAERAFGPFHALIGHSLGGAAVVLALAEGIDARAAVLLAPPTNPGYFLDRVRHFLGLPRAMAAGMTRRVVERVGRPIEEIDAVRAARSLTVPGLILHDPRDAEVPWAHGRAIAAAWRTSRLIAREEVGHFRILGDPETILSVIDFLRESRQPSPRAPAAGRRAITDR
jgi:pimeloyl-ACP methyl ester carboxylesterase